MDTRPSIKRPRSLRPVEGPEAEPEGKRPAPPSGPVRAPMQHRGPRRLDQLQRLEAVSRRGVQSIAQAVEDLPRPPGVPAHVDFVRSLDPGLRIRRKGTDTIEIRGWARGSNGAPRPPSLSVAVGARIFRIDVSEGQSARELARRLAVQLGGSFRALVISETDEQAYLRLSERVSSRRI